MSANVQNATSTSVWDGNYAITCECIVDMDSIVVLSFGEYICGSPDDDVDTLEEEYVELENGVRYTAANTYDWSVTDRYGNGIVRYE